MSFKMSMLAHTSKTESVPEACYLSQPGKGHRDRFEGFAGCALLH
jgi:hypothetical protein